MSCHIVDFCETMCDSKVEGELQVTDDQEKLLDMMAEGNTLTQSCKALQISLSKVWRWRDADQNFEKAYVFARKAMAEAIADDGLTVVKELTSKPGVTREQVQAAHAYAQRGAWYASKMLPKLYGEPHKEPNGPVNVNFVGLVCNEEQRKELIALRESLTLPAETITEKPNEKLQPNHPPPIENSDSTEIAGDEEHEENFEA